MIPHLPKVARLVGAGVFCVSVSNEAFALGGENVCVVGAGNFARQATRHLAESAGQSRMLQRRRAPV